MNCKYCGAQWEKEEILCPVCGRIAPPDLGAEAEEMTAAAQEIKTEAVESLQEAAETVQERVETLQENAQEAGESVNDVLADLPPISEISAQSPAKPKRTGLWIGLGIAALILALIGAAAAIWYNVNDGWTPKENNVFYKDVYTVSDEKAAKSADKVVATIGDKELTNGQLQIHYWMQFYNLLDYYGSYLETLFGMDYTKPLYEQAEESTGGTWEQYFINAGLEDWQNYQVLCILAEKEGLELAEEYRTYLDSLPADMEATAAEGGYEDAQAMLEAEMGAGCTLEDYMKYLESYYYGFQYFSDYYNGLSVTDAEVEAYFTENEADFASSGITKDSTPLIDVRHILIMPEGGTTGDDGYPVYTEEAWAAALTEAEAIYNDWQAGEKTEDSFAALAVAKSEDGNASSGGLYTGVAKNDMVEAFDSWIFDETRQYGDHAIVQTQFGYHIMYFVGSQETWYTYAKEYLLEDMANQMVEAAIAEYPMEVDYRKISLGFVDFSEEG